MVRVAVIGAGYWGKNYVRVLGECGYLAAVVDGRTELHAGIKNRYPDVEVHSEISSILSDASIDAVVIATPASTHYDLGLQALNAGKHILVEKPLTVSSETAQHLLAVAQQRHKIVMVGFTVLFIPAVQKARGVLQEQLQDLGDTIYCGYSTRTNLGIVRPDVSVVWDLAPHDIALFSYLFGRDVQPEWLSANGAYHFDRPDKTDSAWIVVHYTGGVVVNMHVSWADPHKSRLVSVLTSSMRMCVDDMDAQAPLKIYHRSLAKDPSHPENFGELRLVSNEGDLVCPYVRAAEPLKEQCLHFVHCIRTGERPIADGELGLLNVKILEAAEISIKNKGAPVFFSELNKNLQ